MDADGAFDWTLVIAGAVLLVEVAGIWLALDAVMRNRTPQGTIAWAIALLLMPAVSIPFYLAFGNRRFDAYVREIRRGQAGLREVGRRAREAVEPHAVHAHASLKGLCPALERLAALPATSGNDLRLLVDGEATFEAILREIDGAQRYVLSQFYIVREDGIGLRYREALLRARARGVRVHFMSDEIGCVELADAYLSPLLGAGCEVGVFRSTKGTNPFQLNFRNHRKVVVVDGRVAFLGGINVGDEYLGRDPEMSPWRDTHVRVEGPAVLAVQLAWLEDWQWAHGGMPTLEWRPQAAANGGDDVVVLPSGPADAFETCTLMFMHLVTSARRRLWIASPYFVPDEGIIAALQLAAKRGVDVRLVLPGRSDNILVWLSSHSFLPDVIPAGVKVYRYTQGFMHHKVLLCDDTVGIGTANFDNRSFRINFEITLVAEGAVDEAVVEMMRRDFERCHGASLAEFERRPWWFRTAARVARLMSPIQ
jgi:cardiolipin synthase